MPLSPDHAAALALWYRGLAATSNPTFLPLFADRHRYLVLKGGGGSGKSIFAGRKILERAVSEPGSRLLVCRKVARTLRESAYRQLSEQGWCYYPTSGIKAHRSDLKLIFGNGSEIIFAGLDDPEKLKSIYNITGIWIEEASELLESDFNQLDIRLRGETKFYKQIILSFNPVSVRHWLKRRFFDVPDPRARVHESTYHDNRFLDGEAIRTLESFRESDEYYYQVYCLGQWGVTGKSVFHAKALTARLQTLRPPLRTGVFSEDGRWEEDPDGFIRVYQPPQPGVPYVVGADTAGSGSDSFVAQVIDNRTGRQVCILRRTFDEDVFTRQLFHLGMYYNKALIAVETNFSTYPVRELERLRYPKQYVRESMDTYTHRYRQSFGFRTDSATRPVCLATLIRAVREDVNIVCDRTTIEEMLSFVRGEDWSPRAEPGAHDDCVMALAIAHHVRPQQSYLTEEERNVSRKSAKWSKSQWEDYRRASGPEREFLRKKWGDPV